MQHLFTAPCISFFIITPILPLNFTFWFYLELFQANRDKSVFIKGIWHLNPGCAKPSGFLPVWSSQNRSLPPAQKTGSASGCRWSSLCTPRLAAAAASWGSHSSEACGVGWWRGWFAAVWGFAWGRLRQTQPSCWAPQTASRPRLCHSPGLGLGPDPGHGPCPLTVHHVLCPCHSHACERKMHKDEALQTTVTWMRETI